MAVRRPGYPDWPTQDLLAPKRTPLGLLTGAKGSPALFSQIVERLRFLAAHGPTKAARAEVDAVMACPWWGLRVAAVRTVGAWGGAVDKRWLMDRIDRPATNEATRRKAYFWPLPEVGAAMVAVATLLDESDADWVLSRVLGSHTARHAFHTYVTAIPDDQFLAWLRKALRDSRWMHSRELVAMVGPRTTLPGYHRLLWSVAGEAPGPAADAARWWLEVAARRDGRSGPHPAR